MKVSKENISVAILQIDHPMLSDLQYKHIFYITKNNLYDNKPNDGYLVGVVIHCNDYTSEMLQSIGLVDLLGKENITKLLNDLNSENIISESEYDLNEINICLKIEYFKEYDTWSGAYEGDMNVDYIGLLHNII